ncbi:hypothetical protein BJX61DRAFT_542631 [Aspergillus egyptiacus]|nr:hypothetical protein BJX61DRAFT_542631 [Aspergillus egyptiacus]
MWLFRGAQSAVFYYATCTPCAESTLRQKRKKEAVRARSQREKEYSDAIVTDQPRPFPQPVPFSTNPGWAEEIRLGPGPPKRRHKTTTKNANNHRRTESSDSDAFSTASCEADDPSLSPSQKRDKISAKHLGDKFNRMLRHQREDEPLWGEETEVKGSSAGLSGRGKADDSGRSKYYIPRVPPVNDLHPPIVSGPKSRAETRWMLQPPPSAKVMLGKERSPAPPPPVESSASRLEGQKATARRRTQMKLPPLAAANMDEPKTPPDGTPQRESSPTLSAYGKDESKFVISSSIYSASDFNSSLTSLAESELGSPGSSPRSSLQSPATPISRPVSKATNDHPKGSRPLISRPLTTIQHDKTKIHLLHFELQEPDDLEVGQLERVRPWRWSMDF